MNNGFFRFYILAICFSALMCGAITSGFLVFNVIKYSFPLSTMDPSKIDTYSSNERFSRSRTHPMPFVSQPLSLSPGHTVVVPETSVAKELSEDELTATRLQARNSIVSSHKFRARQGIILQVIIILICIILFYPHWRLVDKNAPSST